MILSFEQKKKIAHYLLEARIEEDLISTTCFKCWLPLKAIMRSGDAFFKCRNFVYIGKYDYNIKCFKYKRSRCGSVSLKEMWLERRKVEHDNLTTLELDALFNDLTARILK